MVNSSLLGASQFIINVSKALSPHALQHGEQLHVVMLQGNKPNKLVAEGLSYKWQRAYHRIRSKTQKNAGKEPNYCRQRAYKLQTNKPELWAKNPLYIRLSAAIYETGHKVRKLRPENPLI